MPCAKSSDGMGPRELSLILWTAVSFSAGVSTRSDAAVDARVNAIAADTEYRIKPAIATSAQKHSTTRLRKQLVCSLGSEPNLSISGARSDCHRPPEWPNLLVPHPALLVPNGPRANPHTGTNEFSTIHGIAAPGRDGVTQDKRRVDDGERKGVEHGVGNASVGSESSVCSCSGFEVRFRGLRTRQ